MTRPTVAISLVACLTAGGLWAGAAEQSVEVGKVPERARAAADRAVPGGRWEQATRYDEGGEVSFELEGRDGSQRKVWVTVAADGTVEEVQTELRFADLPEAARKAVAAAVAGFTAGEAYEVRADGEVYYDLEGKDGRGRAVWLSVYADGTVDEVATEVPLREVPAAVTKAVRAKFPLFKPSAAYAVELDAKVIRYDVEGRRPKDKEDITLSVSPDGQEIEIDG